MKRRSSELASALAYLDREHLRRERRTIQAFAQPASRVSVVIDGRVLVDFSSNDYLGLARHPDVAAVMAESAAHWGAGSGASHLITGHGAAHCLLEEALAAYTGRQRALLFSTGYMANLAAMTTLAARGEHVLLDRLSHASLIDGALLSRARVQRYAHGDLRAAGAAMQHTRNNTSVVATDGVFSMDGDVAPLRELSELCATSESWLVVDDAHGIGVIGSSGRGSLEHFGLGSRNVPVLVGTLGKAFGCFGAFIAGDADLIEWLMQRARAYIYTTALPQPVAAGAVRALEIADREGWRRERVLALATRFRCGAQAVGVPVGEQSPVTPIQPILFGSSRAALRAHEALLAAGWLVSAIRPPTVPRGQARLRVTLSAAHTEAQVDGLVDTLGEIVRREAAAGLAALPAEADLRAGSARHADE